AVVEGPVLPGAVVEALPPGAVAGRCQLAERAVHHHVDQLGLAGDVGVDRHGGHAQRLGDAAHRPGVEAHGVGPLDRRPDDLLRGQAGLGPAARGLLDPPAAFQAAAGIAPPGVLRRHTAAPLRDETLYDVRDIGRRNSVCCTELEAAWPNHGSRSRPKGCASATAPPAAEPGPSTGWTCACPRAPCTACSAPTARERPP